VSRYISIDIRPVPSDNAGFLAVKPRPAVGQDFHTAVPGLAEQSLSSRRNLVRISAFRPTAPLLTSERRSSKWRKRWVFALLFLEKLQALYESAPYKQAVAIGDKYATQRIFGVEGVLP
jgi:hypothetical protein